MILLDGQKLAEKIIKKISRQVKILKKQGITPKLAAVLVGNDSASMSFIRKKEQLCQIVGIEFELFKFQNSITEKNLLNKIDIIQSDKKLSGLIIQLPLPRKLNARNILERIREEIDVDCLTSRRLGKLTADIAEIMPPTPAAIMEIIKEYDIKYKNKHIVVVGRGELVGKPLGILLTQKQNTTTMCGKYTVDLKKYTKQADILITAVGKKNLITGSMVKDHVVILDAGTVLINKKLFGDVNFASVSKKASMITPVPGGIGPVTVAKLLENVTITAKNINVDKPS